MIAGHHENNNGSGSELQQQQQPPRHHHPYSHPFSAFRLASEAAAAAALSKSPTSAAAPTSPPLASPPGPQQPGAPSGTGPNPLLPGNAYLQHLLSNQANLAAAAAFNPLLLNAHLALAAQHNPLLASAYAANLGSSASSLAEKARQRFSPFGGSSAESTAADPVSPISASGSSAFEAVAPKGPSQSKEGGENECKPKANDLLSIEKMINGLPKGRRSGDQSEEKVNVSEWNGQTQGKKPQLWYWYAKEYDWEDRHTIIVKTDAKKV